MFAVNQSVDTSSVPIEERIRHSLSRISGSAAAALEDDLDLADDLGLDSLKIVALLNDLSSFVTPDVSRKLPRLLSGELTCRTVGDLITFCGGHLATSDDPHSTPSMINELVPPAQVDGLPDPQLPIAIAQYPFLAAHWVISSCSICSRVRIKAALTRDIVQQAWDQTRQRNPALNGYFVIHDSVKSFNEYQFKLARQSQSPISWLDIARLDGEASTDVVRQAVHAEINREWDITRAPMCRLSVYACGRDEFEVIISNHHLVSDGLGNQIVVREFLEICAALLSRERPALPAPITTDEYDQFVRELNDNIARRAESAGALRPRTTSSSASRAPHQRANVEAVFYRIDADDLSQLKQARQHWNASTCALLIAAYARALYRRETDLKNLTVNVPTGGRSLGSSELEHVVGCLAQNIAIEIPSGPTVSAQIREIATTLNIKLGEFTDAVTTYRAAQIIGSAIPLEAGRPGELARGLLREGLNSHFYLSYVGDSHVASEYAGVKVLDYAAYTTTNPGALDLLVEEFKGGLNLVINFDARTYSNVYALALLNEIHEELGKIIRRRPIVESSRGNTSGRFATLVVDTLAEILKRKVHVNSLDRDLEAEYGLDSLQRVRLARAITEKVVNAHPEQILRCRSLLEMAQYLEQTLEPASSAALPDDEIPLAAFLRWARQAPDACAVRHRGQSVTYGELDRWSLAIAEQLRLRDAQKVGLVGVLCSRGPQMIACNLGILRAGCAYVPLDISHPETRLHDIISAAELRHILVDASEQWQQFAGIDTTGTLVPCYAMEYDPRLRAHSSKSPSGLGATAEVTLPKAESLMTVLFTSGSTGRPKGVMLAHEGYQNRLRWMQKTFPIGQGDRIAYKTSCCFDVSIWEWLWPLMQGATVCVADDETRRNPWALSRWLRDERIAIVHFVPSLFREFVGSLDTNERFPDLRWLIFSGEALPAAFVRNWMLRYGTTVGLANLYGPTEASIDVTAHIIRSIPGEHEFDIPIGTAIDNVEAYVLDENQTPVPTGTRGELWLGGIQLARGYLNNSAETERAFIRHPIAQQGTLYRTGDLVSQDTDKAIHFHGRLDSQVKIRGHRIEIGDVESNLSALSEVAACAVLAQPVDVGDPQLVAYIVPACQGVNIASLRARAVERLPPYMVPQLWHLVTELKKNHNGKVDRKALLDSSVSKQEGWPCVPQVESEVELAQEQDHWDLAPAQKWLLAHFGPAGRWLGFTRFTYKDELDFDCLCEAINWLICQHDVFRIHLIEHRDHWRQVVGRDKQEFRPHYQDVCGLSESEREKTIDHFRALALAELDLKRWPLLRVGIFRTATARHEFIVVGHHMVADMLTNHIFFRELWQTYGTLLGGGHPTVSQHASYRQYVESVKRLLEDQASRNEIYQYWFQMHDGGNKKFFPKERDASGSNAESTTRRVSFAIDAGTVGAISRVARAANCRLYDAIAAALYDSLGKLTHQRWIVISHRMHGRTLNGQSFFSTCGNFAINFPLGLDVNAIDTCESLITKVKQALTEVPWQGASYDAIGASLPESMYPDSKLTPIRLNFLPAAQDLPAELFEIRDNEFDQRFSDPDAVRTAEIECFARQVRGELQMTLDFGSARWPREWMDSFAEQLERSLNALCTSSLDQASDAGKAAPTISARSAPQKGHAAAPLKGKVAVVTGGGRGIGRAIAIKLVQLGARVLISARTEEELRAVSNEITALHGECAWVTADVGKFYDAQAVIDATVAQLGRIDILVNNAGQTQCSSVLNTSPESWANVITTNLLGTFYMSKVAIGKLIESEGTIVNIGSDSSDIGYPLFSAYAASKHGIVGLTKSLAEEMKPHNVRVNAVCPALVATAMAPPTLRAQAIAPEHVADVVAFLASIESQMITGECIHVYGRQDMYWYGSRQAQSLERVTTKASPRPSYDGRKNPPILAYGSLGGLGGGG